MCTREAREEIADGSARAISMTHTVNAEQETFQGDMTHSDMHETTSREMIRQPHHSRVPSRAASFIRAKCQERNR